MMIENPLSQKLLPILQFLCCASTSNTFNVAKLLHQTTKPTLRYNPILLVINISVEQTYLPLSLLWCSNN